MACGWSKGEQDRNLNKNERAGTVTGLMQMVLRGGCYQCRDRVSRLRGGLVGPYFKSMETNYKILRVSSTKKNKWRIIIMNLQIRRRRNIVEML